MEPEGLGGAPLDELAGFVAGLRYESLPAAVRDRVAVLILDTFASALAGRSEDGCAQMGGLASALGGPSRSTVIGGAANSMAGAVLVNGFQIAASSVCDFHRKSLCHVTPDVIPPVLAVAEQRDLSGRELLAGVAAGLETAVRIGSAIGASELRNRGWYPSGVIGPFGGAAAVACLIRLDSLVVRTALSLAGTQSSGILAHRGTPTLTFQQSRGAFSALLAVMLAEREFRASPDILTAERGGIFNIFSDGGSPHDIAADVGNSWELEQISLRRWSVPNPLQPMVDGLMDLIEEGRIGADDVAELKVAVSDATFRAFGEGAWDDALSARSAIRYVAAVVLQDGKCGSAQFRVDRIRDPLLDRVARDVVSVEADHAISGDGTRITLRTRDGRSISSERAFARGDPRDPLNWEEVERKFFRAAAGSIDPSHAERAAHMVSDLASVRSVRDLCAELSVPDHRMASVRST